METNFSVNRSDGVAVENIFCLETLTSTNYLFNIFVGSLSFLIICGNLLVITSIIYFKQLHTPTNFLILSLAVADLLVGILLLPFGVIPVRVDFCLILFFLDLYLCSCSVWNLCFISVDRYYAVCQPLRYRTKINVHVSVIMILLSWTLSALSFSVEGLQEIFIFFLPAIIMCAIYIKILLVAQRQARHIQNTTCQSTKSESKMERKATKTLAIVMGVFLISWSPFFLSGPLIFFMNVYTSLTVIFVCRCLGWFNSMLNPFIYGFFYSWFRSAFRMIISGKIFQGDFTHYLLLIITSLTLKIYISFYCSSFQMCLFTMHKESECTTLFTHNST